MRALSLCAGTVVVAVLTAIGCSSSKTGEGGATGAVQQEIQDGEVDATHKYAVGVCNGSPGHCFGVCSGALILPNVVATARHCVDASPKQIDCTQNPTFGARSGGGFYVTTNTKMTQGGTAGWYAVSQIAVPSDAHICGNDIALLVLSNAVPATDAAPITPGVQYPMWDWTRYDPVFAAIGYGVTGPDKEDSQTRRIRKFIDVVCVPGAEKRACPDDVMAYFSPKEFWGGSGTCSGDSGSSAFEGSTFVKDAPVSFGVLSRGGEETPDGGVPQCSQSFYTRFDAHRDFVLEVAKLASQSWTLYPEPSWTTYVPPPAPKDEKDAGAKDSGAAPTPPAKLGLGEECAGPADCASGVCVDAGDDTTICSSACDEEDATSCADGYECRESLCLPALEPAGPAGAATVTKTTTTTCSFAPPSGGAWGSTLGLGALALLGALRRRRR